MYRSEYLRLLEEATADIEKGIEDFTAVLDRLRREKRRIWVLGNGGSLAVAQHFAQDLLKMRGMRAQCLNDPSVITAYSNDHRFDYAYFSPLSVLRDEKDAVLIFSCSGKSRNYIEFISQETFPILAVVGTDGGFLLEKADLAIHVKSDDYALCETAFSMVADLISYGLEEKCLKA